MSQPSLRTGGCHCGAVRYEVEIPAAEGALNDGLGNIITCNCSICQKRGSWLVFVPAESFKLTTAADTIRDYQFGQKRIHHLFCSTCGVSSYATGEAPNGAKMAAINVRCLDGVDASTLSATPFDGKNL